ncbi:MAG: glycoside hydrolase family 38 C-terminal domain-containing protein [Gemmatimonadota bacterium]
MTLSRRALVVAAAVLASAGALRAQDLAVRTWLVRGPIHADTGLAGLLRDYAAKESRLLPDSGDVAAGGAFLPAAADSLGRVNLVSLLRAGTDWAVAYAHVYVYAPAERTLLLVMDSDDDIVGFVNGQRVWVNDVARGVAGGRDTATVRLAAGWNSVLLKVRNRTGGFDVLGRLAAIPGGGGLDGVRAQARRPPDLRPGTHNHPAPTVTVSPLRLEGPLTWAAGQMDLAASASLTAWGRDTLRGVNVRFLQNGTAWTGDSVGALAPGVPMQVRLRPTFDDLRAAALETAPLRAAIAWAGAPGAAPPAAARPSARRPAATPPSDIEVTVSVDPGRLLQLAGSRLALGSWIADSADGQRRFQVRVIVPPVLAAQRLDLLAPEFGPRATYLVGGVARAWRAGAVELCAPCRAGDTLRLAIALEAGRPWWTLPAARVRDAGYAEYAAGYGYARAFAGRAPDITAPDTREWLAALGAGDGGAYAALAARYRDAYAPLATTIRRDTLHLVGNSHIDAAWLWPWSETEEVIRNTWRTSLKLAGMFPGYVFTGSSAAFYDYVDRALPTLADSIRQAMTAGQWAIVGGMWVEPDQNAPSGESLARQGLYGQRYFQRRFGQRSRVAWTPDSFGYPWTLPQIYRQLGFDAFVTQKIRWNDSTELPYNAFFWEGRDGSRIFTYNPYGYSHELDASDLVRERLEDRRRTGGNHQIVLYGVGDHGGGPTIEILQRAEDLRRVPTFPALRYAHPDSALTAVRTALGDGAFPVWRDELYLEYHRGTYTTQARQKWSLARSEAMLRTAEALAAVDAADYPRQRLEDIWRRVLFNQFHDILPGSSIHQVYVDANATYDTAWALLDTLTTRGFAGLRARMDTRTSRGRGLVPVVVFNPLTWVRSDLVRVAVGSADTATVLARDVPALGAKVVWVPQVGPRPLASATAAPTVGPNWIENALLRVEVDTATGTITRLYDKRTRREVLAPGARGNVLEVFGDRPRTWDAWDIGYTGERWEVTETSGITRAADAVEARLAFTRRWSNSTFTQTLAVGREAPYLEVRNEVDWHETRKLLKVGFTLGVRADSATFAIPSGTSGRAGTPRTQAERAKYEVPGQRWADVSDSAFGVSVVTDSKYGWDYHGNVLRLSLLRAPLWPDSLADRGRHAFRYAVYPHAGDWRVAETVRRAAEFTTPLVAAVEPAHPGPLGGATSFVSVDGQGVELAWVKRAEDADALVLRLVEWHGRPATATVTLRAPIRSARRANLLEDAGEAVPVAGRTFRVALRPYEIATFLVEPVP